uniref:Plastocyanin-like domain-containing protein n=1 Tax=Globodera rostochiensis TaxID=31243 RepID=A0A914HMH5_GLORO
MKQGENVLLRLANGAFEESFYVWIEEHEFWIVAVDGSYVRPIQFDSLLIHPGERYDLLIVAQKNPKLAKIELITPNTDDVDWNHKKCTKESNCAILNCPHIEFISRPLNYTCIAIDQLENAELPLSDDANIFESKNYSENQFSELMLNSMPTFNRWFYKMPKELPFFNQGPLERIATKCDAKKCDRSKEDCHCFHHYEFRLGTIVQITAVTSMNMLHPFHLHGTKFYVMKIGKMEPKYLLNRDVECADKHCIEMKWSNISYYKGNVPLLKKNPILRDTVMIPHMGYVVIRFRATNPGWFFAHCHLLFHHMNGMAFAYKVDVASGVSKIPKPPPNLPKNCGFYDGGERWEHDEDQQQNAMNYFLICLTGLSVLSNLDAFRQQSVGIRGRLMCGNQPLKDTQVKLWNKNTLGSDDQLSSFTTDNQGNFELQGGVGQMTKMNVHFKIYHDCDDGIKPCQRKVNFGVPDHYVERSAQTKKWFEAGTMNMEFKFPDEERTISDFDRFLAIRYFIARAAGQRAKAVGLSAEAERGCVVEDAGVPSGRTKPTKQTKPHKHKQTNTNSNSSHRGPEEEDLKHGQRRDVPGRLSALGDGSALFAGRPGPASSVFGPRLVSICAPPLIVTSSAPFGCRIPTDERLSADL